MVGSGGVLAQFDPHACGENCNGEKKYKRKLTK
jgi:hypothetical protein